MLGVLTDLLGMGPRARAYIRIRGHVYEGGYHFHTESRARSRNLKGWLRIHNMPMESIIEMEVEGTRYQIDRFLEDLQKGPATARVYKADVQWKTPKNEFRDFRSRL